MHYKFYGEINESVPRVTSDPLDKFVYQYCVSHTHVRLCIIAYLCVPILRDKQIQPKQ